MDAEAPKHTVHASDIGDAGQHVDCDAPPDALGFAGRAIVDLHVHVGGGVGPFSVDVQTLAATGVAWACSQGDAGWRNFERWRTLVDVPRGGAATAVVLAINVNPYGEAGGDGSLAEATVDDHERTAEVALANPGIVRMISVNLSPRSLGTGDPSTALAAALGIAERVRLPVLVGLATSKQFPLGEQLDRLRPGDVVTYCYRRQPWCLFSDGRPLRQAESARRRGVLFDVGHGATSFDPDVARDAIEAGFPPDTISSDLQRATAGRRPPLTLARVAHKLWRAGMPIEHVDTAITTTPAEVLGVRLN